MFADEILMKYAARKANDFGNFEAGMTPQAQQERELIRRSQSGDFMATKELQRLYRNTINSSVSKSGLSSVMDQNSALQEANKAFKELVEKNFDLTKENQPNTYILNTLPKMLSKVKYANRDFASRKSEELTMHSEIVATARDFLKQELGREPSVDETYGFVKNKLRTGKSLTPEKIQRIDVLNRKELSGNARVGGDSAGNADPITWTDITNIDDVSPEEVFETGLNNQRIDSIINQLPKTERRFIRNYYGIGEFQGRKAGSLNEASINNGMTYYEAKKVVDKFNNFMKNEGLI